MTKKQILTLSWIAAIIWMAVIFYLSSQPATQSGHLSDHVTHKTMSLFGNFIPDSLDFDRLQHYVRKNAHLIAYLILGSLLLMVLRQTTTNNPELITMAISILYAISDECHQFFVVGRSCEFKDIVIDTSGAIVGIILTTLLLGLVRHRFSKTQNNT